MFDILMIRCHDPNFELMTKASVATLALGSRPKQRLARLRAKREARESHLMLLGSAGKCEGMNLHTPKGVSTLRVGVLVDSQIFKEQLQGSKLNGLKSSLYH
jgi:hypothetical protein